jgi:hypothetical protein
VGTPRGKIQQYEKKWLELPWQKVRESVEVKLFAGIHAKRSSARLALQPAAAGGFSAAMRF